jgi:hypothetical protein
MDFLYDLSGALIGTFWGVLPIAVILLVFQFLVIRRSPPRGRELIVGFVYVLVGLTLFLVGLSEALFPLGQTMARQLTAPEFISGSFAAAVPHWLDYVWVYAFAAAIGFSATVAEPALIAVSIKAEKISGGAISSFGLRVAVAVGVAFGVALGAFRIVSGTPLVFYIVAGYVIVMIQTLRAPKIIIPLAFDSGGVTTSTVTVPVVAALGLGLASTIPGRSVLIDGFGLIAFASVFPIIAVLGYASLMFRWRRHRDRDNPTPPPYKKDEKEDD